MRRSVANTTKNSYHCGNDLTRSVAAMHPISPRPGKIVEKYTVHIISYKCYTYYPKSKSKKQKPSSSLFSVRRCFVLYYITYIKNIAHATIQCITSHITLHPTTVRSFVRWMDCDGACDWVSVARSDFFVWNVECPWAELSSRMIHITSSMKQSNGFIHIIQYEYTECKSNIC